MIQNPGLQDPHFQFTNPKCLIMIAFHIFRVFSTKFDDNNFQFTKKTFCAYKSGYWFHSHHFLFDHDIVSTYTSENSYSCHRSHSSRSRGVILFQFTRIQNFNLPMRIIPIYPHPEFQFTMPLEETI